LEKQHEYHGDIEGESPLSTGIAYHFMHELTRPVPASPDARRGSGPRDDAIICGIFHVGPFTCMQESVATAKIEAMVKEFRKSKPDLVFPIIHAFFGDSPNANLESEIAVFTEQCYQKRELLKEKYGYKLQPTGIPGRIDIQPVSHSKRRAESLFRAKTP